MFSLKKLSYIACSLEKRDWYNSRFNRDGLTGIPIEQCCLFMLQRQILWDPSYTTEVHLWCVTAAEQGHVDCLREARRTGYRMNKALFMSAALRGRAECLDFIIGDMVDRTFSEFEYTYSLASRHLDCLFIMKKHGLPWDGREIYHTVVNRQDKCVRLLLENGCPLPVRDYQLWVGLSNVPCVELLINHGLILDMNILHVAIESENTDLVRYLFSIPAFRVLIMEPWRSRN